MRFIIAFIFMVFYCGPPVYCKGGSRGGGGRSTGGREYVPRMTYDDKCSFKFYTGGTYHPVNRLGQWSGAHSDLSNNNNKITGWSNNHVRGSCCIIAFKEINYGGSRLYTCNEVANFGASTHKDWNYKIKSFYVGNQNDANLWFKQMRKTRGSSWGNQQATKQPTHTCYEWTGEDSKKMGAWSEAAEKNYCENTLGYVFSRGDDSKAPGCGKCWCCRPNKAITHTCYEWTDDNLKKMGPWSEAAEKNYCENQLGFTFSRGDDSKAPGCGKCWCCKPNQGDPTQEEKFDAKPKDGIPMIL